MIATAPAEHYRRALERDRPARRRRCGDRDLHPAAAHRSRARSRARSGTASPRPIRPSAGAGRVHDRRGSPPDLERSEPARSRPIAFPEDAARALARAADYGVVAHDAAKATVPAIADLRSEEAAAVIAGALASRRGLARAQGRSMRLLACYGLSTPPAELVDSPAAAGAAAGQLRRTSGAQGRRADACCTRPRWAPSRSRSKGQRDVESAAEAMADRVHASADTSCTDSWFSRWRPPESRCWSGVVHDPLFGPVVACGAGGIQAELLKDVAVRITPLTDRDARQMIRSLRTYPLLDGFRGAAKADVGALEDVVLRVGALVENHPEIAEMDCNPVIVSPEGALIVDARIRVEEVAPPGPEPALRPRRGSQGKLNGAMATIFDTVIVGFDSSEQAMDALTLGRLLGSLESRDITVAHVVDRQPPFVAQTHDYAQERREKVRKVLEPALCGGRGRRAGPAHVDRLQLTGPGPLRAGRRARQVRSAGARGRLHPPRPDRSRGGGQRRRAVVLGSALCRDRRAARVCGAGPLGIGRCGGRLRRFARVTRGFACRPRARARSRLGAPRGRRAAPLHLPQARQQGRARRWSSAPGAARRSGFRSSAATSTRPSSRAIRSISSPRRRKGQASWYSVDAATGRCTTCWRAVSRRSSCAARPARCWSCRVRPPTPVWPKRARQAPRAICVTLQPHEVRAPPLSPARFKDLLDADAWDEFERSLELASRLFEGRVIWNVNSTAAGRRRRGDAALVRLLLARRRRRHALDGDRGHARVLRDHQAPPQLPARRARRRRRARGRGARGLRGGGRRRTPSSSLSTVRPDDIVILHDPQTAGLVQPAEGTRRDRRLAQPRRRRAAERARAHRLELPRALREEADACVFSRHAYVPDWAVHRAHDGDPAVDRRLLAEEPGHGRGDGARDPRARRPARRRRAGAA